MAKDDKDKKGRGEKDIEIICRNRRAAHDFDLLDRLECGLVLQGTEVKSLRAGHAQLDDAFARIENGEVWLYGMEIPEYEYGNVLNHKPKRPRKLLLHRREIARFAGRAQQEGLTLIPLRLYFKNGRAKVELALARGKKKYDKRQTLRERDAQRQIERALSARQRRR
ncbi:MAG: SsrA-binding protein SmpB [Gemmataceae bacterium]|nr:SsrA-binding protein SmpB [Gemmataceae bacterium]MCS7271700.1 SsrA-binding protein SmpB [Gemmataceae bacterium]MDW8244421.1 SsrA-binding protein SmpB [Thermogemmata sp.]